MFLQVIIQCVIYRLYAQFAEFAPKEELQKAAAEVPVLKKSLAEVEGAIRGGAVFSKWDDFAVVEDDKDD